MRIAIDCSSTRTCDFNSGIQRVVRSLCEQSQNSVSCTIHGIPVHGANGYWYAAKSLWPEPAKVAALTPTQLSVSAKRNRSFTSKVARELERTFRKLRNRWIAKKALSSMGEPKLELGSNDVLLMADASWMEPNWEAVAHAKVCNAKVGLLIYDLIPIMNPDLFPAELVTRFRSWFERAILSADFIVCISKAVASSVVSELGGYDQGSRLAAKTYWFPLGANLRIADQFEPPVSEVQAWFAEERFENPCLVVGTLEPRKNHNLILDAFEQLWEDGSLLSLCLMGRLGWNCKSLVTRIRSHPEFGRKLFMNTEASDADVHHAYSRARAVIMASINEGYGLPIVEGLGYRQTVLASDIPVHREVGQDQVHYFSIDQGPASLLKMLTKVEQRNLPCLLRADGAAATNVISWKESYETLCITILEATHESVASMEQVNRAA